MIEKAALQAGHAIVARISGNRDEWASLVHADMCIEFSNPDAVIENIKRAAALKKRDRYRHYRMAREARSRARYSEQPSNWSPLFSQFFYWSAAFLVDGEGSGPNDEPI